MHRTLRFASAVLLAVLIPACSLADGPPSGFPICTVAGDQLAPVALPRVFPGMPSSLGAMLFWQDLRGWPGDAGDLWHATLSEPWTGDILPVDGVPAVQRPGEQSQPAATLVQRAPSGCQWCGDIAELLAYADAPGPSPNRVVRASRSYDEPANSWDLPLSDTTFDAFDPMAAGDLAWYAGSASGAFVGWLEADAFGNSRLRAQHLGPDGSKLWGVAGIPVMSDASGQSDAHMVADGADGAFFAWSDARHGNDLAIYAMRLVHDGSPAPGWPAAGRLVRTGAELPQSARIVADGAGGLFVMWSEFELLADLSHGLQPRLVRLLGDGSLAPGWPAAGLRVVVRDDAPLYANDLQLDGAGGLLSAMTAVGPAGGRVVVQRLLADGSRPAGWPAAGLEACTGPGSEGEPRLAGDAGVATVVWRDERAGAFEADIYAARFGADGSRPDGWPADGLAVGQAGGIQRSPVVVPRLYGGVAIAWNDARALGTSGWDIWGQTVSATGRLDVQAGAAPPELELAFAGRQPARGPVRFRLGLAADGRVTAEVFDLAGRRLARVQDGPLAAGWHTLEWSGRDDAGAGTPGVRFLRVRTASGERTLRFVTLH